MTQKIVKLGISLLIGMAIVCVLFAQPITAATAPKELEGSFTTEPVNISGDTAGSQNEIGSSDDDFVGTECTDTCDDVVGDFDAWAE